MNPICIWCGADHKNVAGIHCRKLSKNFKMLVSQGIKPWVLFGLVHQYGQRVLLDSKYFNKSAEEFSKRWAKK